MRSQSLQVPLEARQTSPIHQSPDGTSECLATQGSRQTLPIDPGRDSSNLLALQVQSVGSSNTMLH